MNWYPYFLGRNALYALGKHFLEKNIKEIFMPAYACGDEIEVFARLNFKIKFYDVRFNYLEGLFETSKIDIRPDQALLITSYFGLDTKLITKDGVKPKYLIYDYAYRYQSNPIPIDDTFYIFSLRKQFERDSGSYIVSKESIKYLGVDPSRKLLDQSRKIYLNNKNEKNNIGSGNFGSHNILEDFGPRFIKYGGYEIKNEKLVKPSEQEEESRKKELLDKYMQVLGAVSVSNNPILDINLAESILKNRVNFPTFLPIMVNDADRLDSYLKNAGFKKSLQFWNRYNPLIKYRNFPYAKDLKNKIVCFPLTLDWSDCDMSNLIRLLERYV